ncbi:MAG: DUF4097 family beta strand repeat-containing protein, partial [Gammaproteobacteria bacterium]
MKIWRILVLLVAVGVSTVALAETKVDQTRPLAATGEIEISNVSGSVNVIGWDRDAVHVSGTLGSGVKRLEFEGDAKHLRVKVVIPDDSSYSTSADLTIQVPAASRVRLATVSADADLRGLEGAQSLQTVSGDIHLESGSADISAESVSGDVLVRGSAGNAHVSLHSVSGDVTGDKLDGDIAAQSVSGNVTLTAGTLTRLELKSTSGDLDVSGRITGDGRFEMETVSGDVRLTTPDAPDAEFNL